MPQYHPFCDVAERRTSGGVAADARIAGSVALAWVPEDACNSIALWEVTKCAKSEGSLGGAYALGRFVRSYIKRKYVGAALFLFQGSKEA